MQTQDKPTRILFLTQTGPLGPSSRYRVYQYTPYLEQQNIQCTVSPAVSNTLYPFFYSKPAGIIKKMLRACLTMLNRTVGLLRVRHYDAVVIQKEILTGAYPVFEKLFLKTARAVLLDLDDAVYLNNSSLDQVLPRFHMVIAGNEFIAAHCRQLKAPVTVIPTSVDIQAHKRLYSPSPKDPLTLGWVGSTTTLPYLALIERPLMELAARHTFRLMIIGPSSSKQVLNQALDPSFFDIVSVVYRKWKLSEEIEALSHIDIGLAPLPQSEWSKGKCGCKLLQYMAMGIPSAASAVGVHNDILIDGINGFTVSTEKEWLTALNRLITDKGLRASLGERARTTAANLYSLDKSSPLLAETIIKTTGHRI